MSTDAVEAAKNLAAHRAVAEHFKPEFRYIGIGSGTTIVYVVNAIKEVLGQQSQARRPSVDPNTGIWFVPTGYQSRQLIVSAGLTPLPYDSIPEGIMLDVAFDGADEVDEDLNCIKGGGACLFQEKLVALKAKKFVCVADYRKDQTRLLSKWPAIPIEVAPIAAHSVLASLRALGSTKPAVREGPLAKAGPLKTDQDFFIIDAPFPTLLTLEEWHASHKSSTGGTATTVHPGSAHAPHQHGQLADGRWEVSALARAIKSITGVLDVGLFHGENGFEAQQAGHHDRGGQKPVAVYFGMQDGSVKVRVAKERGKHALHHVEQGA